MTEPNNAARVVYTRPRPIPAPFLRNGDQVARDPQAGLFVGTDQDAADDIAARSDVSWVEVDRYDPATNGVWTSDGGWLGARYETVVFRQAVPIADA